MVPPLETGPVQGVPDTSAGTEGANAIDVSAVGPRARRGVRLLVVRLALVQPTQLVLGILLARTLGPAPFGRLGLATAVVGAFNLLSDLGLGAALVRKEQDLRRSDLDVAFTFQLVVGAAVGVLAALLRRPLGRLVWGPESSGDVLGAVILAVLLAAPFRTEAIAGLERALSFGRIAVIEVLEHVLYCGVSIALVLTHPSVEALTAALLIRTVSGAILGMALSGWRPSLRMDRSALAPLLRFGLPYQSTGVLYVLNGFVVPLLLSRLAGPVVLGQVLWAGGNAERPRLVLDSVARVAFPSYARIQGAPDVLRRGFERTIHGGLLVTGLYCGLLAGTASVTVPLLFTEKWVPATPLLYVLLGVFPFLAVASFMDVLFFARGWSRLARNIHLVRFAIYCGVAVPAAARWGIMGFAAGHVAASAWLFLADVLFVRGSVPLTALVRASAGPVAASLAALATSRLAIVALGGAVPRVVSLGVAVACGSLAMLAVAVLADRERTTITLRGLLRQE